ncbi:MAG: TIGR03621 family F420-dependent LLM class oxidoreductase [Acidimicrobiales bacterium]|nr:TIGR03621 family F420-dependent LLM class oxidoreductase [Acidimicrobiales bacterium]MCB9394392.1 TIGR03621 family F420-dependent LLM class oxidoreductase [Acidimicrobiaceae bacterium]
MTDPARPLRPFRFGVQAWTAGSRREWADLARRCETNGYSVLTMPDHFDDQLAPVPALMAAADATTDLRIGALVFDNDYKHPVVLAKELATMDLLSDGRLEIGLGAGWMATDYQQSGIPYDRPGVRIDRFEEGLAIVKGLLGPDPVDFEGRHYRIEAMRGTPSPVQAPRPPILIGGGGRRVLTIAAREADIVGINGSMHAGVIGPEAIASMTAEAVDDKVAIVRDAAGARLDELELNVRAFMVQVTEARDATLSAIAGAIGVEPPMVEATPFALVGPPAKLVEDLLARRDRWGFSYVIVGAADVEAFAPVVAELAGT